MPRQTDAVRRTPDLAQNCSQRTETMESNPHRLRQLAAWYRELAERTASPWIWEARLRTAEDLDNEAARLAERQPATDEAI
jgi:recombinational DNA repair ATPase RecF